MALTIFLIGFTVAVIVLAIGTYYAYECDMICKAYDIVFEVIGPTSRHENDFYISLYQQGVTFTPSEFRKFVAKLIETNRIEVVPDWPRENDTFTLPGNWYRLTSKKTSIRQTRMYDHNVAYATN